MKASRRISAVTSIAACLMGCDDSAAPAPGAAAGTPSAGTAGQTAGQAPAVAGVAGVSSIDAGGSAGQGGFAGAAGSQVTAGSGGAAGGMGPTAGAAGVGPADRFESIDFKGNCWGGIPPEDGKTSIVQAGQSYDVRAIGTEMGHHCPEDQGRLVYVELEGDFDVSAQLTAMDNFGEIDLKGGKTPAKGGLMARVSLQNNSPEVAIWAAMPDVDYPDAWHFDHRSQPGGAIHMGNYAYGYINKDSPLWSRQLPNIYIRLKRTGQRIEGFGSVDGVTWTAPNGNAAFETDFPSKLYVGLSAMSSPEGSYQGVSELSFRGVTGFPR